MSAVITQPWKQNEKIWQRTLQFTLIVTITDFQSSVTVTNNTTFQNDSHEHYYTPPPHTVYSIPLYLLLRKVFISLLNSKLPSFSFYIPSLLWFWRGLCRVIYGCTPASEDALSEQPIDNKPYLMIFINANCSWNWN